MSDQQTPAERVAQRLSDPLYRHFVRSNWPMLYGAVIGVLLTVAVAR